MTPALPRHLTLWLCALCLSACQADLRPRSLREREAPLAAAAGKKALERARQAQRPGADAPRWRDQAGVRVALVDTFAGLTGWFARPWPMNPQQLSYHFLPGRDAGVATFKEGEERVRWGLHEWNAWSQEGSEAASYEQDGDLLFWLPTLQYFLEMAFRLPEAQLVDMAGTIELEGEPHQRVYLTWGGYAPHGGADQYLAYLRQRDGLLTRCDFTVRDKAGFLVGTVRYGDFRRVGHYLLPHRIEIGKNPPEDLLHVYRIALWEPGVELPRAKLAPEPGRSPREKP